MTPAQRGHALRRSGEHSHSRRRCWQQAAQNKSIYQKAIPLQPGTYRLNVVAKDVVAGNVALRDMPLDGAAHRPGQTYRQYAGSCRPHASTSPSKSIGTGHVRAGRYQSSAAPASNASFKQDEKIGIYVKLYNFEPDENTHKPSGQINTNW